MTSKVKLIKNAIAIQNGPRNFAEVLQTELDAALSKILGCWILNDDSNESYPDPEHWIALEFEDKELNDNDPEDFIISQLSVYPKELPEVIEWKDVKIKSMSEEIEKLDKEITLLRKEIKKLDGEIHFCF
jgi:hypothetical protein